MIVANQALNSEVCQKSQHLMCPHSLALLSPYLQEVDEVYFLVFPNCFVILAVGPSLSGYEMKVNASVCGCAVLSNCLVLCNAWDMQISENYSDLSSQFPFCPTKLILAAM